MAEEIDKTERRSNPREKVEKSAKIIYGDERSEVACELRDITSEGARLKCDAVHEWPDIVSVSIDGASPVACQVAWSLNTLLGVKFIGDG